MTYVDINIKGHMSRAQPVSFQTTLRVRDRCLCLHVQRAARSLARRFDQALQPLGLTNGQFSLLMSLNRPKPPGVGSVADLLAMDRTTLTAALKPLERHGLVKVDIDPDDRRGRLLLLTAKGMNLLAKAAPIWEQTHTELEALLEEGEPDRLRRALQSLGAGRQSKQSMPNHLKQVSVSGDSSADSGQTMVISKTPLSPDVGRPGHSGQSQGDTITQISSLIAIDRNSAVPLHKQICEAYCAAIFRGDLRPGQRVLSSRDLARTLCVSRFPVLQAYEQLLADGCFESRPGAGTFIARSRPAQRM